MKIQFWIAAFLLLPLITLGQQSENEKLNSLHLTLKEAPNDTLLMDKSAKSFYPCKSVIPTFFDTLKAHGGELSVQTKENEGSEFVIQLPIV